MIETVLAIIAGAFAVGFWWHRRSESALRRALIAERANQTLSQRLQLVMQNANDIILLIDEAGRVREASDRALAAYGYTLDELRNLPPGGLEDRSNANTTANAADQFSPSDELVELVHRRKDGSTFFVEASARPLESDGETFELLICRDISERKATEDHIGRINRLYAALSQVNQAIAHLHSKEELFRAICRILVESRACTLAWIGWIDESTRRIVPVSSFGDFGGALRELALYANDPSEGSGPAGRALCDRRTFVCHDFASDVGTPRWRDTAARNGIASGVGLPIRIRGEIDGVLVVY